MDCIPGSELGIGLQRRTKWSLSGAHSLMGSQSEAAQISLTIGSLGANSE